MIENAADPAVRAQLDRLRDREVRIVIDDFGTGYSSLSYIAGLPVDAVKVDSSFTPNAAGSTPQDEAWAFIRGILQLITSVRLPAVAEGVESREQADVLRQLECPFAQGYYFCPPLPADQIDRLLDNPAASHGQWHVVKPLPGSPDR